MVQTYPVVLVVLFGVIASVGILLLIKYRDHPYIKFRDAKFLILQNIWILTSATITALYMAMRPNFSCYVYYTGVLLPYSGFGIVLAIRYWKYTISFHISRVRTKLREPDGAKEMADPESFSWFVRNRWSASSRFLNICFVVAFLLFFLVPVLPYFFFRGQYDYVELTQTCDIYSGGIIATAAIIFAFMVFFLLLTYLMWNSRDAYHVKTEMILMLILWCIILVIWLPYTEHPTKAWRQFPNSMFILFGLYGSFGLVGVFPLVLVFRNPVSAVTAESDPDYVKFLDRLKNAGFRNALHDFMKLQFCQENILFYEVVADWKLIPQDDPAYYTTAEAIKKAYLTENGLCQVNISGITRDKICGNITPNNPSIPSTVFDDALKEVLNMIYSNSFHCFIAHPLYSSV